MNKMGKEEQMDQRYKKIIELLGRDKVKFNEPLAQHTTFKIGGPADLFFEVEKEEDLIRAVKALWEIGLPYFILGGGSNILVGDKGFRGIIIKLSNSELKVNGNTVIAGVGVGLKTLLNRCFEDSLTGLEFLAGIPGAVGGAIRGNAGAWQKSIGECVSRVKILTEDGEIKWIDKNRCQFNYRESRFKHNNEVILEVELDMDKGDKEEIKKQMKVNLEKKNSQPKEPSAGCVFVNPKPLSAGELIDECGLKGTRIGNAQISERHANFVINLGGASASDVVSLISLAKTRVKEKFSIDLKEEIVKMGEF